MVKLSVATELKDKPRVTKHQPPLDDTTCAVPVERQTIVHFRETSCCSRRAAGLVIAALILLVVGGATLAIYLTHHPVNRCFDYGPGCAVEGPPMGFNRLFEDEGFEKDFDMSYSDGEWDSQSDGRGNYIDDRGNYSVDRGNYSVDRGNHSSDRGNHSHESKSGSGEIGSHSGENYGQSGDDRKDQSSESNSGSGESDSRSGESDSRSGERGSDSGESGEYGSRSGEEASGSSSESEDRRRGRHHGRHERPIKYDRDGHHPIMNRRPIETWQWRFKDRKHQPGKAGPQGDNDGHPRRPMDLPPIMP